MYEQLEKQLFGLFSLTPGTNGWSQEIASHAVHQ